MAQFTEEDFLDALEEQQALLEEQEGFTEEPVAQPQATEPPQPAPAFVQWDEYKSDPRFGDLSPAQKQNLFDEWQNYATQYLAQSGALSTDEDVTYTEKYFTDLAQSENLRKPTFVAPNYVEQLAQQAQSGFDALEAGSAGYTALLGLAENEDDVANVIASAYRRQRDRYVNPDMKKFTESKLNLAQAAGMILTNPIDIASQYFIQSTAMNLPVIGAAAAVGGATSAVATPAAGVTAGLLTGAAGAAVVDALGTTNEMVVQEVINRGLDPADPEAVKSVIQDPAVKEKILAYTGARGVVIGASELATFGAGKYLAKAAQITRKSSLGKKVAVGGGIAGIETVGEGAGELGGQIAGPVAAGTPVKIEPKEIAAEMFVETPGSVAVGALQTVGELLNANAPATASELTKEAVQAAAEGRYEQILGEGPTPDNLESYYNGLSIANKAKALGLAPNAVLTVEQGVYGKLSDQEKANVQADFERERQARVGPTLEEAEAKAKEAFPVEPAPAPAPAPAEPTAAAPVTPAPAEPTAVAPAPTEPVAPVEPSATKPLTEAPTAPLATVAPATAREAAKTEQAPAPAPAAEGPTGVEIGDQFQKNTTRLSELNKKEQQESLTPKEKKERTELTKANRALGQELQRRDQQQLPREAKAPFTMPTIPTPAVPTPTPPAAAPAPAPAPAPAHAPAPAPVTPTPTTPAPAPAPTPTTAVKKLKPTKKQSDALTKLGYLPADIEGLDRNQAKDILANQIPKTPAVEAPQEIPQAPAPAGATPAPVAPAPVVTPAPAAPAQPTAGEAGRPVAPPAGQPAAPQTEQQRLSDAEKKLQEKVGAVIAEADRLGIDEESVRAWLGPTPSEDKVTRTRAVLRLLNLGIADVYNNLRKRATKGKARQAELIGENGARIRKVILTTREEGAGVLTDPEDMNNLETIYVNPDRLLSRLRGDETTDAADFFVKMMEEELLHLQHGRAALELFVALTPEGEDTPENFKKFFRRQSEEIENSLSLSQIQEVVGKYAGIDTAGKTKEQLIQEFAQVAGRRGRLGEEYLRTLIQRRLLGDITEDKIRDLTPNPVLRSLGMIRNWLFEFIGETIPKKIANQTPVERYFNAVNDLIYGNKMSTVREARDEKNTAIPGRETLSASIDPKAIRQRLEQKAYQTELVRKVNEDFGLGQPREAQKGELWAKTVGKFINKFPSFTPDEITSIVGAEVPDAVKFFDPSQGNLFSTYLYQRGYYAMVDALKEQVRQRRESGRIDVPGSVERERFRPLSEAYKKVKPEEVTTVAKEDEIAAELESIENAAEEEATRVVAEQADEVEQAYSQVQAGRPEEDQTFEELMGEKAPSTELVSAGVSPVQAAIRSDLQKVFDSLFSTFTPVEQDVFDFLFRAKDMENPPTRKGIMAKHNIPHSRQYDRIVEDVREKTADILAENNIFSSAQLTASVDPVEIAKRRNFRRAVSELSKKYGFPISFITSDLVPEDRPKLASAVSKIQNLKLEPEPFVFNFLHAFENQLDWNKIKTPEQLLVAANDLYESQKKSPVNQLTVNDVEWARVETDLAASANVDPEAGLVLAEYNRDPGEAGQKAVLDYINEKRMESVNEWATFLESTEPSPYMRVLAWSIPMNALRQNKIGRSTVAIHPGAYSTLRQSLLDSGLKPIGVEKQYRKIMADISKRGLDSALIVSPTDQWVYIPSKKEDPVNFDANAEKLKYLSAITWCTSESMAKPYLKEGGFWVMLRDNVGTIAIRKHDPVTPEDTDRIIEIQGPANRGVASLTDDLLERLTQFSDIRPELKSNIDSFVSASKRMSVQAIESILRPADPNLAPGYNIRNSASELIRLITAQGAMTLEQKQFALNRAIDFHVNDIEESGPNFEDLSANFRSFINDSFYLFATLPKGKEYDALAPILFNGINRVLNFRNTIEALQEGYMTFLNGSQQVAMVFSNLINAESIPEDQRKQFSDYIELVYGYTPILASPKFLNTKEKVTQELSGAIKEYLPTSNLPLADRRLNEDRIKSLVRNPLADQEEILKTIDQVKKLAQTSKDRLEKDLSVQFYWELVTSLIKDTAKPTRKGAPENFFVPKKELAKISKATRIKYFDRYVLPLQNGSLLRVPFVDQLGTPEKGMFLDLAEAIRGLGERPEAFIESVLLDTVGYIKDGFKDRDITPFLQDVAISLGKDKGGNVYSFMLNIFKKALVKIGTTYDRNTEVMPANVREWITTYLPTNTTPREKFGGMVTATKMFRDSLKISSQRVDKSNFINFNFGTEEDRDNILDSELDMAGLADYGTQVFLELIQQEGQLENAGAVVADIIENLLEASPRAEATRLLTSFIVRLTGSSLMDRNGVKAIEVLKDLIDRRGLLPSILKANTDFLRNGVALVEQGDNVVSGYARSVVPQTIFGIKNVVRLGQPQPSEFYDFVSEVGKRVSFVYKNLAEMEWGDVSPALPEFGYLVGVALSDRTISQENIKKLLIDSEVFLSSFPDRREQNNVISRVRDGIRDALYRKTTNQKEKKILVDYLTNTLPEKMENLGIKANTVLRESLKYILDYYARTELPKIIEETKQIPKSQMVVSLDQSLVGTEAFYDQAANRLFFVEDNIRTVTRGRQLFFHEATHGNIAYLETTEKGKKELNQILNSARKELLDKADSLAARSGFSSFEQMKLAYNFQDDTEMLGELLARYAEDLIYGVEPNWFVRIVKDLIGWFKRNLGLDFNREDLLNWLAGRMQRAAEGERLAEISTPQLAVGPASIARNVLTASIDPKATSALRRAKLSMPEEVLKVLNVRTYLPYENKELLRRANDFVDSNMEDETDIYSAKRKLDQTPESAEMPNPLRILTLGVIGKRLKDAMFALDQLIKRDGNSPELAALRDKYSNDMIDVLSAAQDLLSASGQDLQAGRVFANLFTPEQMVRIYTKPISDAQKKLLASNQEVERLKAMIKALKEELASKAVDNAVKGINIPLGPEDKFYNFVGLFGDVEPSENESFQEYLNRMGIDYASLLGELEGPITASVDPKTNENPLPKNLRELNAREAVRRLVALDKNFFSKLIALRLKTGQTATQAQVATAQENKKRSRVSRENRPIEMQMVFDFFNSTLAQAPASEETIDKDDLPVMVRMAKYAADAVTDRILRSFGLDKKTTPKGLFDRMEREIRGYVNAQFRAEMDPKNVSVEDDRTPEQKIIDLVERIGMAEQVFNQTKANLQARLDEDTRLRERRLEGQLPDADRKALEDAVNRTFDPGKILARSGILRQLVDFKAEARKHLSQRGATLRSLSNMIRIKFPQFNDKQVEALSSLIVANYDRLVKEAGQTQINNIIKRAAAKDAKALLGKAKEPKKQYEKLLELINLGAFEDEKFYNAIAEGYGLPAWDPEVAADIRRQAEQVDRLPQGSDQRSVAGLQLTSFIQKKLNEQKKGYEKLGYIMDVAASVWKAGVLSGPGTQIINLASTYGNVGLELLFSAFGYAGTLFVDRKIAVNPSVFLMDLIGTYFDNLGRVPVQEAMGALITGYGRLRSETQRDISPLEAFSIDANLPKGGIKGAAKWSLNNYLALWKLVGRAMAAADTYNASIANEAKLRMQARYNLMSEGMTKEQADVEMRNLFSSNNDMMNGVRDQVEQEAKDNQFGSLEGLKPGTAAYKFQQQKIEAGKRRRLAQLREEAIATKTGIDLQEDVRNFAQVATFNNRPTGLIGYIGDSIATFGGRFPLFAPFTSFTRTVANIVNAGLNYTPYGFLRLAGFSIGNFAFQNTNYEFRRPQAEEFYKLAGQAVMGTLLITALARLLFEDMEEPWDKAKFAVTGLGPTDKNQRDQLRATGWAENSVKIQTPLGPLQFRHSDIPGLSLVFGALGMMSDSMRYGTLSEEDKVTLAAYAAASLGSVVFEKNLLTGAKSLFDILRLKEDPVAALQKGAATYVGGITNPGAFKWLAETVGVNERGMVEKIDYRKLNSSVPGFLMGLTPIAVKSGAPKLNRLGEPVEEYPWAATTRRVGVFPEVKPHPVLSPLVGAGLFVPGVSRLTQIQIRRNGKPETVRVDATENTYYDYAKYNGQYLKRVLSPARAQAIASRAKFDPEGAQAELEKLAGQARRYAIDRIEAQIRVKGLQ